MDPNDNRQRCRVCGCTDDRPCEGGCAWVEPDLCVKCVKAYKVDFFPWTVRVGGWPDVAAFARELEAWLNQEHYRLHSLHRLAEGLLVVLRRVDLDAAYHLELRNLMSAQSLSALSQVSILTPQEHEMISGLAGRP